MSGQRNKVKQKIMFKKAIDLLEECKSLTSKEDAENVFGKHKAHQLISFSQRQQYLLHFKIQELIY